MVAIGAMPADAFPSMGLRVTATISRGRKPARAERTGANQFKEQRRLVCAGEVFPAVERRTLAGFCIWMRLMPTARVYS